MKDEPGNVGPEGRPFILESETTRSLLFTLDAVQTCMHLADPDALVTPYTRKMMAFLLFMPVPRHVLMIGLGGGALAKFCHRYLPRTRISVVEISAEVIALREKFAIPPDDERFEVIHEDGATFLAGAPPHADVMLIDAFDRHGVAPSLATPEFYTSASGCLTPDGVLVMNLSGLKSRYPAHIDSVREAFAGVRLVPVEGDDNLLLFAFKHRRLAELPAFLQLRADYLERGMRLEFSRFLKRLRDGHILGPRCR
jgi:spermidine synthase